MVKSIGFQHLLDLRCESVPRGICLWLANQFDVNSKSLLLPNGSRLQITAGLIEHVLGIPNGGKPIMKKCDESLKKFIANETGCKGTTPTINELKSLLDPDLVGDKFKRVFTLFAVSCFLCPTSYGCISSDYYSAVEIANEIGTYDWCTVVLDKITQSIDFYKKSTASSSIATLGGCILVLVIIYFELLDVPLDTPNQVFPRLKLWSTDMVKAFATLDTLEADQCIFGRLPLKDMSKTCFQSYGSSTCTNPDLANRDSVVCNLCSGGRCKLKDELASATEVMGNDIMNAIKSIVIQYSNKVHRLWHSLADTNEQHQILNVQSPCFHCDNTFVQSKSTSASNTDTKAAPLDSEAEVKHKESASDKTVLPVHGSSTSAYDDHASKHEEPAQVGLETYAGDEKMSAGEHVMLSKDTSSFMHAPSSSEDSPNVVSYDLPAHSHSCQDNQNDNSSDSLSVHNDTIQLKPYTRHNGESKAKVFPSQHYALDVQYETTAGEAEQIKLPRSLFTDGAEVAALVDKKKETVTKEFDFWGDGMDSDFEVKAPAEKDERSTRPACSNRKRPTSLNESALNLYMLRRQEQGYKKSKHLESCKQIQAISHSNGPDANTNLMDGSSEKILQDPLEQAFIEENPIVHNQIARDQQSPVHSEHQALSDNSEAMKERDTDYLEFLIQCTPSKPLKFHFNFTSTVVEKELFKDIVDTIPFSGPRPRIVQIKKDWVDHKTFGLSMRVYGTVSKYVIDITGQAVMGEQHERSSLNSLPAGVWYRHVVRHDRANMLQDPSADAQALSKFFTEPIQGYRLDKMHLVFLPLFYDQFWYLTVANLCTQRFEVLIPNDMIEEVKSDAENVIRNFKRMFNYACPHSKVEIWKMDVYRVVTCSKNHCDSGVFVMKLMQSHDGDSQHLFKPEDAKILRECLSYYLLTHPCNSKFDNLVGTKRILSTHGINFNSYS